MRILLVSMLDVWSLGSKRGAPSFYETVRALAAHHQVDLVCSRWSEAPDAEFGPRVTTTRIDPFPSIVRAARAAVRRRRPKVATDAAVGQAPRAVGESRKSTDTHAFYVPGGPATLVELAKLKLEWTFFQARLAAELAHRRNEPYDLVYGYEVHSFPAAAVFARARGIPFVARFQGTTLDPILDRPLLRAVQFEHELAMRAAGDLVIMTNDGTRGDRVLRRLGVPESRVRYWRNGVDRVIPSALGNREVLRASLGIAPDAYVLLSVGRLVRWKRVDRSLELMAELREVGADAVLVVIGDGTERGQLEAMATSLGIAPWVRFLGAVDHDRLGDFYASADLFVSFNDLSNAANPVFEAMASGLPVLTLDVGGTRDVVTDRTGILLSHWDRELAADAALGVLGNVAVRSGKAEAARAWADTEFWSWDERMGAELAELERLVPG